MMKLATKLLVLSASISAAAGEANEIEAKVEEANAVSAGGSQPEHGRELYGPKLKCDCYAVCAGKYGLVPYDNANCDYVDPHEAKKLFVNCYHYTCAVQQCAPGTVFDGYGCGHPKFEDIKWEPYCIDHVKKDPKNGDNGVSETEVSEPKLIPSPCGTDGKELYFPEYYGDPRNFIQCEPTTGKCYRKMCMGSKKYPTFWYEGYGEGACTYPFQIDKLSCTANCGGYAYDYYSDYYCYCDEACYYHGDCCYDYRGQCLPYTCSHLPKHDSCQSKGCTYDYMCDCQCDAGCSTFGDCCSDAAASCEEEWGDLGEVLGIEQTGGERFGERVPPGGPEGEDRRNRNRNRRAREEAAVREIAGGGSGRPVRRPDVSGVRRGRRMD